MPPPEQRKPFPDAAHEALATWVEETFGQIKTTRVDVGKSKADTDDALLLVDTLFVLLDAVVTDNEQMATRIGELEAASAVLPEPDAAG